MKVGEIIESLCIVLAIFSLWPIILKWDHVFWKVFMYAMLAAMIWVFVRRAKRYSGMVKTGRNALRKQKRP